MLPGRFDLGLSDLGLLDFPLDLSRGVLAVLQRPHEFLVVQDVPLRGAEKVEAFVLEVPYLVLVAHEVVDQRDVLVLEFGAFLVDDLRQELVLQAFERHREVDDGHFVEHFGEELRVR